MSEITVITLHGLSGSGKDSTYQAMRDINPNLPRVSFGDILRGEIYAATGLTSESVGDERKEQWLPNPDTGGQDVISFKDLMVRWGRRQILVDPFHYTKDIGYHIRQAALTHNNPLVVVTDCRRPHELAAIRSSFRTYSYWLEYGGAVEKPLDRILEFDDTIYSLDEGTIADNVDQIIEHMIRFLPLPVTPK